MPKRKTDDQQPDDQRPAAAAQEMTADLTADLFAQVSAPPADPKPKPGGKPRRRQRKTAPGDELADFADDALDGGEVQELGGDFTEAVAEQFESPPAGRRKRRPVVRVEMPRSADEEMAKATMDNAPTQQALARAYDDALFTVGDTADYNERRRLKRAYERNIRRLNALPRPRKSRKAGPTTVSILESELRLETSRAGLPRQRKSRR